MTPLSPKDWSQNFTIGARRVGAGRPCFVIAEIGRNHNGDLGLAKEMIAAAAAAGADAVKFQTFDSRRWWVPSFSWKGDDGAPFVPAERFREFEFTRDGWAALAAECRARNIEFTSSPFDLPSVELLDSLGAAALKVASGEFTDLLLVEAIARRGRPVVLSTGMSSEEEVRATLETVRRAGLREVVVLKCTSSYPTPLPQMHVSSMTTLRRVTGTLVGLSDHSESSHAALAAVALGAAVLERHFTIDRDLPGVDQKLSIVPDELKRLIADVRAVEIALGSPDLGLREIEKAFLPIARRSLCAARDLPAGHRLAREDLDTRRPIGGIPPARWREVLKRPLPAPVAEGEMIPASLLAGPARTAPTRAKKSRGGAGGAAQKPPAGKARQGRTPSARRSGRGRR